MIEGSTSMLSKEILRASLPAEKKDLRLRMCELEDLFELSRWPEYPFPFQAFTFTFRGEAEAAIRSRYEKWRQDDSRFPMILDHKRLGSQRIGYFALLDVDWDRRSIGNLAVRIHPDWCDQGMGTQALRILQDVAFGVGFRAMSVNVAASNQRALRCYQRAGFSISDEAWRPAPDLLDADLSASQYAFLRPYVRFRDSMPMLRFDILTASSG